MFRWTIVAGSAVGTIVGGSVLVREFSVTKYAGNETLEGKTVVITGANSGLGKETAIQLAKRKADVIMTCRDLDTCLRSRADVVLKSGNKNVKCSQLDLASVESIKNFVKRLEHKNKKVHLLVNNAGVMRCPRTVTAEGFEMQLGVNHLGHFLLTNLLLESLKSCAPSRIINVSSSAHFGGTINFEDINSDKYYNAKKAYAQSKLANVLFTRELATRLKGSGVFVFAVHPGIVNTNIGRHMGYSKSIFSSIFVKPLLWLFTLSTLQGVQTILYCALNKDLENDNYSGKYFVLQLRRMANDTFVFRNCEQREPSAEASDDVAALKLWLLSEKWTRLSTTC